MQTIVLDSNGNEINSCFAVEIDKFVTEFTVRIESISGLHEDLVGRFLTEKVAGRYNIIEVKKTQETIIKK